MERLRSRESMGRVAWGEKASFGAELFGEIVEQPACHELAAGVRPATMPLFPRATAAMSVESSFEHLLSQWQQHQSEGRDVPATSCAAATLNLSPSWSARTSSNEVGPAMAASLSRGLW
jgi:hypothetical protein